MWRTITCNSDEHESLLQIKYFTNLILDGHYDSITMNFVAYFRNFVAWHGIHTDIHAYISNTFIIITEQTKYD